MKRAFSLITFALVIALVFVNLVPASTVSAEMMSRTVKVASMSTGSGSATGAISSMRKKDQSGTADNPARYVLFSTPGAVYRGTRVYKLPAFIHKGNIETLKLRVNIKAPAPGSQQWIWSAYNWSAKKWVKIGDNTSATANTWSLLTLQFPAPASRFINSSGQVKIRLHSSNDSGNAKIDSEFVLASFDYRFLDCGEAYDATWESQVLTLINQERAKPENGSRPALTRNSKLDAAARLHSSDMACNNYFSHTSLFGTPFNIRITNQGYSYSYAGENIAAGYNSPQSVVAAWMNSDGHRANILSNNYMHIGIGYAYKSGSQWGHYWTTDFASP